MKNNFIEKVCKKMGMDHSKIQQKSDEWKYLRSGLITASEFDNILPNKNGKYGTGRTTYMANLATQIADRSIGDEIHGKALEWGITYEPVARAKYSMYLGEDIIEVPFFIAQNERLGCSPDGMTKDFRRGFEIKCHYNATYHTKFLMGTAKEEYFHQANYSMYLTGADSWDLISYNPRCTVAGKDLIVMQFTPNKELYDYYDLHISTFLKELDEMLVETYGIGFDHKYYNFKGEG